jgi:cytoskeletal protein CcmA (bactofilin family)
MITEVAIPSLIAEGTQIQGDIVFLSVAEIFGIIEGQIIQQSLDTLRVGRTGWVKGSLSSQGPVIIEGRVDGNIISQTRVRLSATAIVTGQISAPAIEICAGALLDGDLKMNTATRRRLKQAA